jgi:hypothetical protein
MSHMKTLFYGLLLLFSASAVLAQDDAGESGDVAAQANNPLANMTAFNLHN